MKSPTTLAPRSPWTFLRLPAKEPLARRSLGAGCVLLALASSSTTVAAQVTFDSRNGANLSYCGPFGGPLVQHNFSEPVKAFDAIAVSHPGAPAPGGAYTPSEAASRLDACPSSTGFTVSVSGDAARGPFLGWGTAATADARDFWTFTVATPTRFRFRLLAGVSSSETQTPISGVSYLFTAWGGGGQILPDPGMSSAFGGFLSAPGTLSDSGTGILLPGTYQVTLQGRTESNYNTYPFSGSFQAQLEIDFIGPSPATPSGTPPPKGGSLVPGGGA
jgi:hypothetical protein